MDIKTMEAMDVSETVKMISLTEKTLEIIVYVKTVIMKLTLEMLIVLKSLV